MYEKTPHRIRDAANSYLRSDGRYVDAYAWQFEPSSFREIMDVLTVLELSTFEVERIYPTTRNTCEFYAVLRKALHREPMLRDELPPSFDANEYLLANPDVARAGGGCGAALPSVWPARGAAVTQELKLLRPASLFGVR